MSEDRYWLSVRQPWATALVGGWKNIETRRSSLNAKELLARQPLVVIHAGKQIADDAPLKVRQRAYQVTGAWQSDRGVLVGAARLVDLVWFADQSHWDAAAEQHLCPSEWFDGGCWGLVFSDPVRFHERLPVAGTLGLNPLPAHLDQIVTDALERARR